MLLDNDRYLPTCLLDSGFRRNDRHLSYLVIPAKAGIHEVLPLNIELLRNPVH